MKRLAYVLLLLLALIQLQTGGCRLAGWFSQQAEEGLPEVPLEVTEGEEPTLKVFFHEENQVKEMDFEEYISGVVAGEMENDWSREVLAAQAIIARSFTLQQIDEAGGVPERNAHASTDIEEFQAYSRERVNENIINAVQESRGMAAVHDGEFIKGWFHAYAGPRTALATEGLEEDYDPPYIHIVESPTNDLIPEEEANWSAGFELSKVREAVKEINGEDPGSIEEVEVLEEGPSGRATRIRINDSEVSAPSLRLALDSTKMRSTFIDEIGIEGERLEMSGEGFGHGVGMCQWGARALAEEGRSAREIVDYYYDNIEVAGFWD